MNIAGHSFQEGQPLNNASSNSARCLNVAPLTYNSFSKVVLAKVSIDVEGRSIELGVALECRTGKLDVAVERRGVQLGVVHECGMVELRPIHERRADKGSIVLVRHSAEPSDTPEHCFSKRDFSLKRRLAKYGYTRKRESFESTDVEFGVGEIDIRTADRKKLIVTVFMLI